MATVTAAEAVVKNAEITGTISDAGWSAVRYVKYVCGHNQLENWVPAAIAFAVVLGLAFVLRVVAEKRLRSLAAQHHRATEFLIQRLIRRTHPIFYAAIALFAGSLLLIQPMRDWRPRPFQTFAVIMLLIQSVFWLNELIEHFVAEYRRKNLQEDAAGVMTMAALGFIAKLVVVVVIGLLLLVNLGVEIGPLLATVGVASLAIGLALQNILGDLFASLSIVLDKPFVLGDFIVVDDKMGTVEDIGLKTTRLRSISGEQLIFGNGDLLKSRISNFKRMWERRVVFRFGLAYATPADKLERVGRMVRDIIEAIPDTRFDRAHFIDFGDSALQFEVVYFVTQSDYNLYRDIHQRINLELIKRFEAESIGFAFPTRTVQLVNPPQGS